MWLDVGCFMKTSEPLPDYSKIERHNTATEQVVTYTNPEGDYIKRIYTLDGKPLYREECSNGGKNIRTIEYKYDADGRIAEYRETTIRRF